MTSPPMAASPVIISDDVIAEEIIPKLPIESVIRFQLASKFWRGEVRDRFFSRTSGLIVDFHYDLCNYAFSPVQPSLYSVPLHNNLCDNLALLPPPAFSSPSYGRQMLLGDSSNGLLLYKNRWLGLLVYNPTTKQSIQLPRPPPGVSLLHKAEIGFDPQSSPPRFMVARAFRRWSSSTSSSSAVLQLFSSRTNNWREFETSVCHTRHRFLGRNFVFTETSVFVFVQHADTFVLRFDFQEESFQRIELPRRRSKKPFRYGALGKCNGSVLYAERRTHLFKVWKLETTGRSYGWTPAYEGSYDIFPAKQLPKGEIPLIRFMPDSDGMLVVIGKNIYSYDLRSNAPLVQLHVVEEDAAGLCRVFPFSLCPIYIPMGSSS